MHAPSYLVTHVIQGTTKAKLDQAMHDGSQLRTTKVNRPQMNLSLSQTENLPQASHVFSSEPSAGSAAGSAG